MIAMSHNLGLQVTAEGIETEGQLEFLQSLDCTLGQGFHLGRPLPADEFAVLLEAACLRPNDQAS